jgi:hypothetical protein
MGSFLAMEMSGAICPINDLDNVIEKVGKCVT